MGGGGVVAGTPPRRRGGLRRRGRRGPARRNTPVSAGRTWPVRCRGGSAAEHPRVGGEDRSEEEQDLVASGTPPRRRGGRQFPQGERPTGRNTPASAGRTSAPPPSSTSPPEHPRVGGEDVVWDDGIGLPFGTPPRRRGGPRRPWRGRCTRRNTPASAGRTARSARSARTSAEHPRVGGEDINGDTAVDANGGTPPRRRGGPYAPCFTTCSLRNTPASAGEDGEESGARGDGDGTPPRRRGGHGASVRRRSGPRNTPASAGRTAGCAAWCGRRSEHPRVGGEDAIGGTLVGVIGGTPPRRRGGQAWHSPCRPLRRNTPASAGRTK